MSERIVHIDAPYFNAGIVIDENDVCISAAPILKWAMLKRMSYLGPYFDRKGWLWHIGGNDAGDIRRAEREGPRAMEEPEASEL